MHANLGICRLLDFVNKKKREIEMFSKSTLDYISYVFICTGKSSIHMSLYAKFLLHGLRVPVNQGVVSSCLVDVNLIILQGLKKTNKNVGFQFKFEVLSKHDNNF